MHYGAIKYNDIADGEGVRTSLFVSGCRHHCKNCFQPETWDFSYGNLLDGNVMNSILESLEPAWVDGLTVLGGEPMEPENQHDLAPLLEQVRARFPEKTIWIYTGDVYEDLVDATSNRHTDSTDRILNVVDILVDGPFVEELKDITLRFKGSSNQRIIDVKRTREQGEIVLWKEDPQFSTHRFE